MKLLIAALLAALPLHLAHAAESDLAKAIAQDYKSHLAGLYDHFHRNPELSFMETKTAARLAAELRGDPARARSAGGHRT